MINKKIEHKIRALLWITQVLLDARKRKVADSKVQALISEITKELDDAKQNKHA